MPIVDAGNIFKRKAQEHEHRLALRMVTKALIQVFGTKAVHEMVRETRWVAAQFKKETDG